MYMFKIITNRKSNLHITFCFFSHGRVAEQNPLAQMDSTSCIINLLVKKTKLTVIRMDRKNVCSLYHHVNDEVHHKTFNLSEIIKQSNNLILVQYMSKVKMFIIIIP